MAKGEFTDEELEQIKTWDPKDFHGLFEFLKERWRWPQYVEVNPDNVYISTGGWSGHEEAMSALRQNSVFWLMHWEESKRGGHYRFTRRKASDDKEEHDGTSAHF